MKKIISIISILVLIGVGIILTSSTSGKSEINSEASMMAPDHTILRVVCDKGLPTTFLQGHPRKPQTSCGVGRLLLLFLAPFFLFSFNL